MTPRDQFPLRLPVELRRRVDERAEQLGLSVNATITLLLAEALDWKPGAATEDDAGG